MRARNVLVATLVVLVLAAACGGGPADLPQGQGSSRAFLEVRSPDGAPVALFADEDGQLGPQIGSLAPRTKVIRLKTTELAADDPYSLVDVVTGGVHGWVRATSLRVDPDAKSDDGSPLGNPSAFEKMASTDDPQDAVWMKTVLACVASLGHGAVDGALSYFPSLFHFVWSVLSTAWDVLVGVADFVLYTPITEWVDKAGTELQATYVAVAHAIPAAYEFLRYRWLWFQALPAPDRASYVCYFLGEVGIQTLISMAISWGIGQLEKILQELFAADTAAAKAVPLADRADDFVELSPDELRTAAATHPRFEWDTPEYWDDLQGKLSQVPTATDPAVKQALIRDINENLNIVYKADRQGVTLSTGLGQGNCGYAATSIVATLVLGTILCPLGQPVSPEGVAQEALPTLNGGAEFLRKRLGAEVMTGDVGSDLAPLAAEFSEGQLGLLYSFDGTRKLAHGTALIKLDGKLLNLNNGDLLGLAPGSLQTAEQWNLSWRAFVQSMGGDPNQVNYLVALSSLKIP